MENKTVSIIMPSYNTADFILDSIQSVLNQTYSNWELIIIDDNSDDNTLELINKLNDPRIKKIINKTNKGAAYCRNVGISAAKGRWIAFLDSDDLWDCTKLEKQIKFMLDKKIYFSCTYSESIKENGDRTHEITTRPKRISKLLMYLYCWPGCLTVMYDQHRIGKISIKDIKKNNDYALWLKIVDMEPCFTLPQVLAQYRIRNGSISRDRKKFKLIKHHYLLWRFAEEKKVFVSIMLTILNLFFYFIKKIFFVKKGAKCEETI